MKKFNFTKAKLEALTAGDIRAFYYDQTTRGLAMAIELTGRKTFYYYKKVEGKPKQIKLGAFPDMSIEQARNKVAELNTAVANQQDTSSVTGRRRRGEMTFKELFDWWMRDYAVNRRKSHAEDQAVYNRYLSSIGGLALSKVTKAELRRLHAELGRGYGERTANKALELVRAVFNRAIEHDHYDKTNPVIGVDMFERRSRDRRLMPGEVEAFFKAVAEHPSEDIRDYVLLSLFTGQRQANVLSMRWDQVDFVSRIWRIPETKNGQPLVVPLEDVELDILTRRKTNGSPWVFPSRSKAGHMVEPKRGWADICDSAGIRDLHLHDLRRSLGSFMVDTGASLPIIGKALGHKSQAATAIYARLTIEPVRAAKGLALEAIKKAARGADVESAD